MRTHGYLRGATLASGALVAGLGLVACTEASDAAAEDPRDALLVSVDALDPVDVLAIDLRPRAEYDEGHLPGALWVDADAMRAERDGVAGQVAEAGAIETLLSESGVDPDGELLVYDDGTSLAAARFVWTMQLYGGPNTRVLDGGWTAWLELGGEVSTEEEDATTDFFFDGGGQEIRVDAQWVLDHLDDSHVVFVDARSPTEYGAGRIPGALNLEWVLTKGEGGRFLGDEDLADLYAGVTEGDDASRTYVSYCKSGMRGSVTWLTLRMLGHDDVRLYDGSWNEWGADPELPQEP